MSKAWNVVETKAKLSEVLKRAEIEPQVIENRGEAVAVILSFQEFKKLQEFYQQKESEPSAAKKFLHISSVIRKKMGGVILNLPERTDRKTPKMGD